MRPLSARGHSTTLSLYLHVCDDECLRRGTTRDVDRGSPHEVELLYRERYLPGQAVYRAAADPRNVAHIVLDNSNVQRPVILRWQRSEQL